MEKNFSIFIKNIIAVFIKNGKETYKDEKEL